MSRADYKLVSAASVRNKSSINLKSVYPTNSEFKTVGMIMSRDQARTLACSILALTENVATDGDINFTAFRGSRKLNVSTYSHWKHS